MYYVYITTNPRKTTLYIGMTNNLQRRLYEHANPDSPDSFTASYHCYHLIYYEEFPSATQAIEREKQLKKWSRKKKEWLIAMQNPEWKFLNSEIFS